MSASQAIVIFCWAIFLFYWFANWDKVKPTKEKNFGIRKFEIAFRSVAIGIGVLLLLSQFLFHDRVHFPSCQIGWIGCSYHFLHATEAIPLQVTSIILAALGLLVAIIGRRTLGGNWSATLDLKEKHELITTGIYQYIRHPIYAGVILMLLGTLLAFHTLVELVVFIGILFLFMIRIRQEEALMMQTFPKEYPLYKKQTKALIPFIL